MNATHLFVIGFNKCGTTSIHRLFQAHGYRCIHWHSGRLASTMRHNHLNGNPVMSGYEHYQVFSDMFYRSRSDWFEGNSLYAQLDQDYPGSLFLYNYRDTDDWIHSRANHKLQINGETLLAQAQRMLGAADPEVVFQHWRDTRAQYEAQIHKYFSGRQNYQAVDICDPALVTKLSEFTGASLDSRLWQQHNKTHQS